MNHQERLAAAAALREWAELDDTALGETCLALCNLAERTTYLDDVTLAALDVELISQLENFRRHARIVEETHQQTVTFKAIDWL